MESAISGLANFRIILAEYRGKLIFCEYMNFMNMYTKFPLFSPPFSSYPSDYFIVAFSKASEARERFEEENLSCLKIEN